MFLFFSILFFIVALTQIGYWLMYYLIFRKLTQSSNTPSFNSPKVSVIICAKNEATNLQKHLPIILQQHYPTYEVLVVDDKSNDDTWEVLVKIKEQYPHLSICRNENTKHWKGKKSALDYGIKKAKYDAILVTDADCFPQSSQWITTMMAKYQNNIVLGYAPYFSKKGILNKWIQWETLHTFIQYSSYAQTRNAYMGVGRNMVYSKTLYQNAMQNVSFIALYNTIPSGDDDLLLQEMAKHANVQIQADAKSFMYSEAPTTWNMYWRQKARHTSTGKYYKPLPKFLLGMYALSHVIFWILGIALILYSIYAYSQGKLLCTLYGCYDLMIAKTVILIFMIKLLYTSYVWQQYSRLIQTSNAKNEILIRGDLFWAIYNLILSPYIFFKNKQQWK